MQAAKGDGAMRSGPERSFADRVFENEINLAIQQTEASYERMLFREALKCGFFDLQVSHLQLT